MRSFLINVFINSENIISKESLLWWSKEGLSLCYATIDNSGVGDNVIVYYGSLDNKTESGSLDFVNFKFPKVSETQSE